MSNKPKLGGYFWRQDIKVAVKANGQVRECLRCLLEDMPAPVLAATYIAKAACQLSVQLDALHDLERIGTMGNTPEMRDRT